jgi:V/A-type H+-transporting ATPase subunit K
MNRQFRFVAMSARVAAALTVIAGAGATLLLIARAAAAAEVPAVAIHVESQMLGWAFIGAALSTGLAALGAAYAVARVGSAAVGAIAEKPELFGRVLVLIGLAEGIAIYGLIISILILNRVA